MRFEGSPALAEAFILRHYRFSPVVFFDLLDHDAVFVSVVELRIGAPFGALSLFFAVGAEPCKSSRTLFFLVLAWIRTSLAH